MVFALTGVLCWPQSFVHAVEKSTSGEVQELKNLVKQLAQRVHALEAQLQQQESQKTEPPLPSNLVAAEARLHQCQQRKLEAVKAEKEKQKVTSGNDKIKLAVSGHVNRAVMFADNGNSSKFFHVDNDTSSTRFKFKGEGRVNEDFKVGAQIVMQVESNSSSKVDIIDKPSQGTVITDRQLEVWFDHKKLGRLWVGKGKTASDHTNDADLSATNVIADGPSFEEFAGSMSFYNKKDPQATEDLPRVKEVWDGFNGLRRTDRIRYDTPSIYGFTLGATHLDTDSYDGSLKFAGSYAGYKIKAAAAVARKYPEYVQYNASLSVLAPFGISVAGSTGSRHFTKEEQKERKHADMWFAKLGYQREWFELGKTAIALDYGQMLNLDKAGDRTRSYGAFLVQRADIIAAEFFWGWRWYKLSRRGDDTDFATMSTSMLGARVKF
ncbi:MAG: porin [Pseudomonadota bacterium]